MSNTRGRQPVGLNQPPSGGSAYPFVSPSDDVLYLLADFFVSFDDLADEVVYPLRIAWMYGFGNVNVSPPAGWPSPTHTHDLVVLDANNAIVFNSTTAIRFTTEVWDNRLLILEWTNEHNVCRCSLHTEWTESDIIDGQSRSYNNHIVPARGELQADTWYKLPKRLLSLRVGLTQIKKSSITFAEGYNVKISQVVDLAAANVDLAGISATKSLIEGTRLTKKILIESSPTAGLGVFPGCVDEEKVIRTINLVRSNVHQNFIYDSEGCIRTQRPVSLTSTSPRIFNYSAAGLLTQAEASSAILVSNDCTNCCDCLYFAQTYQGLKRQWYLFKSTAINAEEVRDRYAQNKARWLVQKQIREANVLRVRISLDGNCKVRWGVAFCNASKCCLTNVTVYLTWIQYVNGVVQAPIQPQFDCLPVMLDGDGQCDGPVPIVSDQTNAKGNVSKFTWDYSNPQTVTTLYGRHCMPDCKSYPDGYLKFKLHVAVTWESALKDPATGEVCVFPEVQYSEISEEAQNIWETSIGMALPTNIKDQKITPLTVADQSNPYCRRCSCTEDDNTYTGKNCIDIVKPGRAIFGFGGRGGPISSLTYTAITNLVSNIGVVAADIICVGTPSSGASAATYGMDKAIFGFRYMSIGETSITNLVSNLGVVASDTVGVGTVRSHVAATGYGGDKAIFGFGRIPMYLVPDPNSLDPYRQFVTTMNLVSNIGVVSADINTAPVSRGEGMAAGVAIGAGKAVFLGQFQTNPMWQTNIISVIGVVSSDIYYAGITRGNFAVTTYGQGTAIAAFGVESNYTPINITNKISKRGEILSDIITAGEERTLGIRGASYGTDKGIMGFGETRRGVNALNFLGYTNKTYKVSCAGNISSNSTTVGTPRVPAAAGYGT